MRSIASSIRRGKRRTRSEVLRRVDDAIANVVFVFVIHEVIVIDRIKFRGLLAQPCRLRILVIFFEVLVSGFRATLANVLAVEVRLTILIVCVAEGIKNATGWQ